MRYCAKILTFGGCFVRSLVEFSQFPLIFHQF
ncbi:hypothetical protein BFX14_02380 [Vibrio cholerae]|nr:hypothetical protein BFX14_02380 [Vibrio cholerae]